jgi:hypothetical protein
MDDESLDRALWLVAGALDVPDADKPHWIAQARRLASTHRERSTESSEVDHAGLTVALSGGGFRATAFSLGVLVYLIQSGMMARASGVISVSGGSVTNGFVAARSRHGELNSLDTFTPVARDLARRIASRGFPLMGDRAVQREPAVWIVCGILVTTIVIPVAISGWWPGLLIAGAAAILAASTVLALRGKLLTLWLRRTLGPDSNLTLGEFDSEGSTRVDHVMCSTDLLTGEPCYLSTFNGGRIVHDSHGIADGGDLRLVDAVRASASFPGLVPPFRFGPVTWSSSSGARRASALLSDGGVWNNFGTDWLDATAVIPWEMQRMQRQGLSESDVMSKIAGAHSGGGGTVLVVVDAGEQPQARTLGASRVPGLATLSVMARVMSILYASSLVARVGKVEETTQNMMVAQAEQWGGPGDPIPDTAGLDGGLPLTVRVALLRELGHSAASWQMAGGLRHWYSQPQQRQDEVADLFEMYSALTSDGRRSVPTTFNGLGRATTLELILRGYLVTRETMSSAFYAHRPPELLAPDWFESLLPRAA